MEVQQLMELKKTTMWAMVNHNKRTALHEAIQNKHSDIVETMHKFMKSDDFEGMAKIIDEELRTPLHLAAEKGQFLLEFSWKKSTTNNTRYKRIEHRFDAIKSIIYKNTVLSGKIIHVFIHTRVRNPSFTAVFFNTPEAMKSTAEAERKTFSILF